MRARSDRDAPRGRTAAFAHMLEALKARPRGSGRDPALTHLGAVLEDALRAALRRRERERNEAPDGARASPAPLPMDRFKR